MLRNALFIGRVFLVYLTLCVGCFLMLRIIAGYTVFEDNVQFLAVKQNYVHNPFWKSAFYVHVFSAIIALFAGFTQFSADFFKRNRKLHRLIGHIYVWDILVLNFPAGMVLAVYANGLMPGRIAFVLLDSLWFYFTIMAVICAYKKDFTGHRKNMIYSYALTFSAITLRTWKLILSNLFTIDAVHLYMIDAWMGFVPNLLLAAWIVRGGSATPALIGDGMSNDKTESGNYSGKANQ